MANRVRGRSWQGKMQLCAISGVIWCLACKRKRYCVPCVERWCVLSLILYFYYICFVLPPLLRLVNHLITLIVGSSTDAVSSLFWIIWVFWCTSHCKCFLGKLCSFRFCLVLAIIGMCCAPMFVYMSMDGGPIFVSIYLKCIIPMSIYLYSSFIFICDK